MMEARSYHQVEIFDAAVTFARSEGIAPAPESAHAIKCAIDEALKCKETVKRKPYCSTSAVMDTSTWHLMTCISAVS
jgi:predicted alternative tryptophan synthase beta-subunit